MASGAPVSPAISARVIHGSLVMGVVLFWLVAWYLGRSQTLPISSLPDRRVLYLALFLASAVHFGAAMFTAGRLTPPIAGESQDQWWQRNLGKAVTTWALVEAPSLLGLLGYLVTRDFRVLLATLAGLLLFGNYRPGRLLEP
jgi:hypothetical protein